MMTLFKDEQGQTSSARIFSAVALVATIGFGIAGILHHPPPVEVWSPLTVALGGGALGSAGPRIASYFSRKTPALPDEQE